MCLKSLHKRSTIYSMGKAILKNHRPPETYGDVAFKALGDDLEDQFRTLRLELQAKGPQIEERLKDVCRGVRQGKLEFAKILQSFGATYRNNAQHFVDLACAASDIAQETPFSQVASSLQRHAREILAA